MERKEINAILVNEFENFLKEKKIYKFFLQGKILCAKCGVPITTENIAIIYFKDGYKFRCDKIFCFEDI